MSSGPTHWCYECGHPIALEGREATCPYCHEGFVQELTEKHEFEPYAREEFHPMADFFYAIHGFMAQRAPEPRFGLIDASDNFMRQRIAGQYPNFDLRQRSDNALFPEWSQDFFNSGPSFVFHGTGDEPRSIDFSGLLMAPELESFIQQLTMNDHRGPPPASHSSIDAMPTIKITPAHLRSDSHCPVCQDKFELGSEARKMPVTIFIILTVLFLGWFSITPVLYAVLSFHHQDRAVPVMELMEEGMPVAAVIVVIAEGGRTKEGEIHYQLGGRSDLPFQTLVIMLRPPCKQLFY